MCQATTKSWGTSLWGLSRSACHSLLWRDSAWLEKLTANVMEQSHMQTPSLSAIIPPGALCWASLERMWVIWSHTPKNLLVNKGTGCVLPGLYA